MRRAPTNGALGAAFAAEIALLDPLYTMPSYGTVKGLFDAPGCTDFLQTTSGYAPFTASNSGTGSAGTATATVSSGRAGIISLDTGTDATGRAGVGGGIGTVIFGGGVWSFRADVNIATAADVTNTFISSCGFMDTVSATPTRAAFFRYQYTENSGNWTCVTVNGGAETTTDTGIAAVHATAYRALEISTDAAAANVYFWVDGVLKATHTVAIPTAACGPNSVNRKTAGGTSRSMLIDLMGVRFAATTGR